MNDELYRFKTEINLINYAASLGYKIDKQETCKNCTIMRNGKSKISISTSQNGHDIFYDFRKEKGGSIIDFVFSETGKNLGQIRQALRPWINETRSLKVKNVSQKLMSSSKNRRKVMIEFKKTKSINSHVYLEERGIKRDVIKSDRFSGKIYSDTFGNAIFPHYDHNGITGFFILNQRFKGFATGSEKGLWFSNFKQNDTRIVLCESAIDAMSYHQLKGNAFTYYLSIDGQLTQKQLILIDNLIDKNRNKKIILAFDNDPAGHKYVHQIKKRHQHTNNIIDDLPKKDGMDWNDILVLNS